MKTSYRVSSGAVLLVLVVLIANKLLFHEQISALGDTAVISLHSDYRGHLVPVVAFSILVWLGSFFILMMQGLRNRTVPRSVATVSLVAFAAWIIPLLRRVILAHSYTPSGIALLFIWVLAVVLMCVHQIVRGPGPQGEGLMRSES